GHERGGSASDDEHALTAPGEHPGGVVEELERPAPDLGLALDLEGGDVHVGLRSCCGVEGGRSGDRPTGWFSCRRVLRRPSRRQPRGPPAGFPDPAAPSRWPIRWPPRARRSPPPWDAT